MSHQDTSTRRRPPSKSSGWNSCPLCKAERICLKLVGGLQSGQNHGCKGWRWSQQGLALQTPSLQNNFSFTLLGLDKTSQFYLNHLMLSSFPNFFLNASGMFSLLTTQSKNFHKFYPTDSFFWLPVEEMADKTPFYRWIEFTEVEKSVQKSLQTWFLASWRQAVDMGNSHWWPFWPCLTCQSSSICGAIEHLWAQSGFPKAFAFACRVNSCFAQPMGPKFIYLNHSPGT